MVYDFTKFNSLVLKLLPKKLKTWHLWNGYCLEWGYIFAKTYGGKLVEIRDISDYYHVMVLKNGLLYDAGHEEGMPTPPNICGEPQLVTHTVRQFENRILINNQKRYDQLLKIVKQIN